MEFLHSVAYEMNFSSQSQPVIKERARVQRFKPLSFQTSKRTASQTCIQHTSLYRYTLPPIPTSPALKPFESNMPTPAFALPRFYTAFFLIIEPISALVGAFYAHFRPLEYLQLTHAGSAPSWESTIPLSTSIVLSQLANLYLLFAINEALVLRSTSDLRVWKTVLFGLLLADFGHLYSVKGLGADIYWNVLKWNRMDWGNVGFVYAGATMRMLFLAGFGMDTASGRETAERVARRANLEKSK